jgi:hypothetical protein
VEEKTFSTLNQTTNTTMKINPSILRMASVLFAGMIAVYAAPDANAQRINPATGLPASGTANAPHIIDPATGLPVSKPGDFSPEPTADDIATTTAKEVHGLIASGQYEDALQHCLSFQRQLKGDQTLKPLLSDWAELNRRLPKAREALIEIRDRKVSEFSQGRGYSVLFSEVSAINSALNQDDVTYALFKSFREKDPQLAKQCYPGAESLLMAKGDYQWCYDHMGDAQERFDSSRQFFEAQLDSQKHMAETRQRIAEMNRQRGMTNSWSPPDFSARSMKSAENNFVGQTRPLIEILVATGHKADAEKIRDEAVAILDDPRLKSAVSDAEEKIQKRSLSTVNK